MAAAVVGAALAVVAGGCSEDVPFYSERTVHTAGWSNPGLENAHNTRVQEFGYSECFVCHGKDLGGGSSGVACADCHSQSPQACNFCHGDEAADPDSAYGWAPPVDLAGSADFHDVTVGAHRRHLRDLTLTVPVGCEVCHLTPADVDDPSHLDGVSPAEVIFGGIAAGKSSVPHWNRSTGTCSNIYCHGEFDDGNEHNDPVWTSVGQGAAACGTCHGVGADEPHAGAEVGCSCHGNVVSYDGNEYRIEDRSAHINGDADF